MNTTCAETVSILYAVIMGAGDACIRIDIWSILTALGAFLVIVVIAQFLARKLWAKLTTAPKTFSDVHDPRVDRPIKDDPNYKNSAIRSAKR